MSLEDTPLAPSEGFDDLRSEIVESGGIDRTVKPAKKRGRPTNAERLARGETLSDKPASKSVPVEIIPTETLVEIIALPFDLYSKRAGDHWKLEKAEKDQIGRLANKVLSKHSPEWLQAWADEMALAGVLGMVIVGRMMIDANNREKAKRLNTDLAATPVVLPFTPMTESPKYND